MEVIKSIWISDDLDRVSCGNIRIDILTNNDSPSVLNYVSVIWALGDGVSPHSLDRFAGLTVTHNAKILHAINLSNISN